jgi:HEAT repeat protein
MKKRRLVLLSLLAAALAAGALAPPQHRYYCPGLIRREPFYDGMPACYWRWQLRGWIAQTADVPFWRLAWLRRLLPEPKVPSRPQVLDGGPAAVPVLIELAREEELWIRVLAVASLGRVASRAKDAVPVLIEVLSDHRTVDLSEEPGDRWNCVPLIRPMHDEAAEALGHIGPEAMAAVPALLELWREYHQTHASSMVSEALKQIDPADTILIAALKDHIASIRVDAARALDELGCETAIPALRDALRDTDAEVRVAAASALWRIERDLWHMERGTSDVIAVFVAVIGDKSVAPGIRRDALGGLKRLGPWAKTAIPVLIATIKNDEFDEVRRAAAQALKRIAPNAGR